MLGNCALVAFATTADPERAKTFYRDTLGLKFLTEDPAALVFEADGTTVRLAKVARADPAAHTILGWMVPDIGEYVGRLLDKGVSSTGMTAWARMIWKSARFLEAGASLGSRIRTETYCH